MENKIKDEIQLFFNDLNDDTQDWEVDTASNYLEDANKLLGKCLEVIKELEEEVTYQELLVESRESDIRTLEDKLCDLETDRDLWRIRANELGYDNKSMCDQIEDLEEDLKEANEEIVFWKTKYEKLLYDFNK